MIRHQLRYLAALAIVAVAALAFAGGASADHLPVADANDTRGPLDIRRVEVKGKERPIWKVTTHGRWTTAAIFDFGFVTVFLDTLDTRRPDFYILIGSRGTHLYADLWRDRANKADFKVGDIKRVWRTDRSTVSVRLPLSRVKIGRQRTFFRWFVESLFTGDRCRRVCFDLAPNDGPIVEPLPVETPPPSPTPSITISPSSSP
jgi:hypothetical protein